MFNDYKDVVGVKELRQMLDIGRDRAYQLLDNGEIKHIRIGKMYRIPKIYVIEYIERQVNKSGLSVDMKEVS